MVVGREIATESAGRPGRWDYQRAATNVRAMTRIGPRIGDAPGSIDDRTDHGSVGSGLPCGALLRTRMGKSALVPRWSRDNPDDAGPVRYWVGGTGPTRAPRFGSIVTNTRPRSSTRSERSPNPCERFEPCPPWWPSSRQRVHRSQARLDLRPGPFADTPPERGAERLRAAPERLPARRRARRRVRAPAPARKRAPRLVAGSCSSQRQRTSPSTRRLAAPADQRFQIDFKNNDPGILPQRRGEGRQRCSPLKGDIITGVAEMVYDASRSPPVSTRSCA